MQITTEQLQQIIATGKAISLTAYHDGGGESGPYSETYPAVRCGQITVLFNPVGYPTLNVMRSKPTVAVPDFCGGGYMPAHVALTATSPLWDDALDALAQRGLLRDPETYQTIETVREIVELFDGTVEQIAGGWHYRLDGELSVRFLSQEAAWRHAAIAVRDAFEQSVVDFFTNDPLGIAHLGFA